MEAEEVEITQGGIGFARTGSARVTAGGVGVVAASGKVELEASIAFGAAAGAVLWGLGRWRR